MLTDEDKFWIREEMGRVCKQAKKQLEQIRKHVAANDDAIAKLYGMATWNELRVRVLEEQIQHLENTCK